MGGVMANNPLVLTVRFFLELTALWALGYWGWTQHTGLARVLLAIGVPLAAATVWGVFRVPGYQRTAPVAVRGSVRLLVEAAFFGGAAWALVAAERPMWAMVFGVMVVVHYVVSYDFVGKMLR